MKQIIKLLSYLVFLFMVQSCATYDGQIKVVSQYKKETSGTNIFLIGDAEKLENGQPSKAIKALNDKIKSASKNDVLLYLGDNIYPKGSSDLNNAEAKKALQSQIDVGKNFKGKVIFLPGDHDWYSGIDGLKVQEDYIENALGKNSFLPENGCPLAEYNVSDDIIIIAINSEWYITNWDKHPKMNVDCNLKSREKFIDEFKSLINKNQDKTIVLAMHHPLESHGSHGGQFPFNPLKAPFNALRNASGISPADLNHPLYRELSNKITTILQEYKDNVIVVSGHDHNLQYLVHKNIPQIISGSGSKVKEVRHYIKDTLTFGYAGLGFSVLNIQEDKQTVQYYNENNQLIHSTVIREIQKEKPFPVSNFPKDSLMGTSIYTKHTHDKSKSYNSFFGNHYRQLYYKKYNFPVVDLDTLFGGLKTIKLGGGNQSVSLRLEDSGGNEYVMRRMRKSATQFIQVKAFQENYMKDRLGNTVAERFIMDFYTTSYPFAAILTGGLSDIVGVYHTNPQFYYVPKQRALGNYNDYLGNDLYLIEERVSKGFKLQTSFGNADDIVSTDEVIDKITKDEKYTINHQQYIKTRLFDMWLGDWDRHEDQYRWAQYNNLDGTITFAPIPRDRDQAFPKFDGFSTVAATRLIPSLRLMQSFDDDIRNVNNFNQIIYKVDKILINKSSLNEWLEQAKFLQEHLTDDAIEKAISDFPNQFKNKNFEEIVTHLKNRRQHFSKWAETYYTTINKNVILQGTDKDDLFEITRLENGFTQVKIIRIKNTIDNKDEMFDKIFDPKITTEIWLYGLDDKDQFLVSGTNNSKIKIRLIGGQNEDTYQIDNKKNIKIHDYISKENIFEGQNVYKRLSDDYEPNNYDFHKFKHNLQQLLPTIGYNPDEGLTIGGLYIFTKNGYELNPFTQKHYIGAKYFSETNGYELDYTGEFARIFGKSNLRIATRYTTPAFAQNFFGFGNETENLEDNLDIEYYRTRLEQFNIKASFVKRGHLGSEFSVGIPFDYIKPNDNNNRFLEENSTNEDLKSKQFFGVESAYLFQNKNNKSYSTLGIEFSITGGWKINAEESKRNFAYISSAFQLDYPILRDDKLTFSTLWKGHVISTQNFEFYQAASIGGKNGLRGYRNERFSGQTSYYQNTDLRWNITRFNSGILPAILGAFIGFDYGRVWLKNDNSNIWHTAYGGGLYVNTAGLLTFQASYFSSDDGGRFIFGLGFGF